MNVCMHVCMYVRIYVCVYVRGTEKMAPEKMAPEKMAPEKMAPGTNGTRKKWHYVNLEKMAPQEKMSARGPSNSARVFLPSYPVYN